MRLFALIALFAQSLPFGSVGTGGGPPANPWTVTNNQTSSSASTTALATSAFTAPLTNGSIILVGQSSLVTVFSGPLMHDTAGNTYTIIAAGNQFGPGTPNLWCAANTHTTASNIVTLTMTGGPSFPSSVINAIEVVKGSGPVTCADLDDLGGTQFTSSSGSNNAFCGQGGKLNLTQAPDFVYIWTNYASGSTVSAGTSPFMFTLAGTSGTNNSLGEYYVQPTIFGSGFVGTTTTSAVGQTFQSFCAGFHP